MDIQKELDKLRDEIDTPRPDSARVLSVLQIILTWLNDNNTDGNCRLVDTYVSTQIDAEKSTGLSPQLAAVVWDMGGALHDTHTSPEVASNFLSTPPQLLERLEKIAEEKSG